MTENDRVTAARVTVYVPTHNRAALLPRTLESVLAQTFDDFRVVVSDNASTDETPEVVAGIADPRLSYVRQPENRGILGNHNWILADVSSEYALIIPDDDLMYPDLLAQTVRILDENPGAGMVHTAFDVIDGSGEILLRDENWTHGLTASEVEPADTFIERSMVHSCRICASTALMRAKALPAGGMSELDFPAIDFGMWLRMAAGGWSLAFHGVTLAAYRIHGGSHSAQFGAPTGPGYLNDDPIIDRLAELKRRFIEEHVPDPDRAATLTGLARKGGRIELIERVRAATLPRRAIVPTLAGLARVSRTTPGVLLEGSAWRLAAASLLGPKLTERIRPDERNERANVQGVGR
jgi:glycosyltransferase involved in cell wall biosynthesis